MPSRTPDTHSRRLFAAGVGVFEHPGIDPLPLVASEIETVCRTLTSLGFQAQRGSENPRKDLLLKEIGQAQQSCTPNDLLVIYYTSHGVVVDAASRRFYLLAHQSEPGDFELHSTAISADDFVRNAVTGCKAQQILLIVDTCFAGATFAAAAQLAAELGANAKTSTELFVLVSSRYKQEAGEGRFVLAFASALGDSAQLGGRTQRYIAIDELTAVINESLRNDQPKQEASWSAFNAQGRFLLFPNPRYVPEIPVDLDLDMQKALEAHWLDKGRGAEGGVRVGGWYFTGRKAALREICHQLAEPERKTIVVTGGPGSGKSALLARMVTLSDPTTRRDILSRGDAAPSDLVPVGMIDVAIHARHKVLSAVCEEIAVALDLPSSQPSEIVDSIAQRSGDTTIVIDALDEADEASRIARELLDPLSTVPTVRLVVGTRPDKTTSQRRFGTLGNATVEIDLDDQRYLGEDDIAHYVKSRLLAAQEPGRVTPYAGLPEVASAVASVVSKRAAGVFLVAYTATLALLADTVPIDTTRQGWADGLPTGMDAAFAERLGRCGDPELSPDIARHVLSALAFAQGPGLPWSDLWPAVASALAGAVIDDTLIEAVLAELGAFVTESNENGRSVYRLYHERMAEILRGDSSESSDAACVVFDALLARVPMRESRYDWPRAHVHLKKYLPMYAKRAGRLPELLADPQFLVVADPDVLISSLMTVNALSVPVVLTYRRVFGVLRACSETQRRPYIALALLQGRPFGVSKQMDARGSAGWRPAWVVWRERGPARLLATGDSVVRSLAVGTRDDGLPMVASARLSGEIEVRSVVDGRHLHGWVPMKDDAPALLGIHCGMGETILVAAWSNGHLQVRNLDTRKTLQFKPTAHAAEVLALCTATRRGEPVCVISHLDGSLRMWSLRTLELVASRSAATTSKVYAMREFRRGESSIIVSGGDSLSKIDITDGNRRNASRLHLWNDDLEAIWREPEASEGCIKALDGFKVGGDDWLVVSQEGFGPFELWRLSDPPLKVVRGAEVSRQAWLNPLADEPPNLFVLNNLEDFLIAGNILLRVDGSAKLPLTLQSSDSPPCVDVQGSRWTPALRHGDDTYIVSADADSIYAWAFNDMRTSVRPRDRMRRVGQHLFHAVHSVDGLDNAVFVATHTAVTRYDTRTGQPIWSCELFNARRIGAFASGGNGILYVALDEYIHRLDLEAGGECLPPIEAGGEISRLCIVGTGEEESIYAAVHIKHRSDSTWCVLGWRAATGDVIPGISVDGAGRLALDLGEEDKRINALIGWQVGQTSCLAFASEYKQVMVVQNVAAVAQGVVEPPFRCLNLPPEFYGVVSSLHVLEAGRTLACGTERGDLALLDIESGECLARHARGHLRQGISGIDFLGTDHCGVLVSGGRDGFVRFWSMQLMEIGAIRIGSPIVRLCRHGADALAICTSDGLAFIEVDVFQILQGAARIDRKL